MSIMWLVNGATVVYSVYLCSDRGGSADF